MMMVAAVTGDEMQEGKLELSGLSVGSGLWLFLASAPQGFPLNKGKRRGKLNKKVSRVGVLIYFVIPVLITVEKPLL